jgi:2-polyprenyl-3-methyl-5-hydroxy-6-metoxy-1,4-benzoquinol methylase
MMKNKLKKTSDNIFASKVDNQEKNKNWWEELPMTYADWESENRIPKTKQDFLRLEKLFLEGNPFLIDNFDFSKFKDKKVLEIGCGSGVASCIFVREGAKVTAIDITQNAIDMTKKNALLQKLKLNIKQEDAENLGLKNESFDFIFSWGVLHHSQNTLKTFEEVSRILKNKGEGLIMVYNKNSLRYYLNGIYWLIFKGKIFKRYSLNSVQSFYTDGYYHRHFTPKELEEELKKRGLKCTKISITHMGTRMIPFLPRRLVEWLKKRWGWLLVAEFIVEKNKICAE